MQIVTFTLFGHLMNATSFECSCLLTIQIKGTLHTGQFSRGHCTLLLPAAEELEAIFTCSAAVGIVAPESPPPSPRLGLRSRETKRWRTRMRVRGGVETTFLAAPFRWLTTTGAYGRPYATSACKQAQASFYRIQWHISNFARIVMVRFRIPEL